MKPQFKQSDYQQRNPLGYGVTRHRKRYKAQIQAGPHIYNLGCYDTPEQASLIAEGARLLRDKQRIKHQTMYPGNPANPTIRSLCNG